MEIIEHTVSKRFEPNVGESKINGERPEPGLLRPTSDHKQETAGRRGEKRPRAKEYVHLLDVDESSSEQVNGYIQVDAERQARAHTRFR
jgi:hypothetical protein